MRNWTREETIVAFNVYCKIPFKSSSKSHPTIIKYAKILGRTPSALNMKVGNIGRLDPDLKNVGIKGLTHGAKIEEEVWNEFYGNPDLLAYESEKLIAKFSNQDIELSSNINTENLPIGVEREAIIKQRVNQSFFRATVISSYNQKCCISGVSSPALIEACHIVSWSQDKINRTNPKNGLCLNSFFHKAYDNNLIGITPDLKIVVSEEMLDSVSEISFYKYLKELNDRNIILPDRFLPNREFLELHYNNFLSHQ